MEPDDAGLTTIAIFFNGVDWGLLFVYQVRVEDVEFVSLNYFGGRIVMVVMRLVIFIPLITSMHAVKVLWLSRTVFIMPPVHL